MGGTVTLTEYKKWNSLCFALFSISVLGMGFNTTNWVVGNPTGKGKKASVWQALLIGHKLCRSSGEAISLILLFFYIIFATFQVSKKRGVKENYARCRQIVIAKSDAQFHTGMGHEILPTSCSCIKCFITCFPVNNEEKILSNTHKQSFGFTSFLCLPLSLVTFPPVR